MKNIILILHAKIKKFNQCWNICLFTYTHNEIFVIIYFKSMGAYYFCFIAFRLSFARLFL